MRKFKDPVHIWSSTVNQLSTQVVVAGEAIDAINALEGHRDGQAAIRVRQSILTGLAEALDRPIPVKKAKKAGQ